MAFITADRVKDTSTTTGTGNITVSGAAPTGYQTFSAVLSAGDTFYYCIQNQTTAEWEVGLGTYSNANVFARTTVLSSSNSGSAVSFSSGIKNVFITLAAAKTLQIGPSSTPVAGSVPYGTGNTLAYSAAGTAGQVLTSGGSGTPTWATAGGGTVTSVNVSGGTTGLTTSGGPVTASGTITLAGTLAVANGGTGVTTSTGSGNNVLSASPTLTGTVTVPTITSPAATALTIQSASTTAMTIDTSGNVGIGQASINAQTRLAVAGANTVTDARGILSVNSTSAATTNFGGSISLGGEGGGATTPYVFGSISGRYEGSAYSGYLQFSTTNSLGTATERMRIDSSGNVGIGATANASAILDAQSTTKGVRFPNMTTTQKNAVSSPAAGLVVFDTTLAKLCVYSGSAWQTITSI